MHEGVIQYQLHYQPGAADPNWPCANIDKVRNELQKRGMLGQDNQRYGGLGFGNISMKMPRGFIITGSQTGHLQHLSPADFALVLEADIHHNRLFARGPCQPSSEALSHGACYQLNSAIGAVIHIHDKKLWSSPLLPRTPADAGYGTVAMAESIQQLFTHRETHGIFAMQGHEDGVIAFAGDLSTALKLILDAHQEMP